MAYRDLRTNNEYTARAETLKTAYTLEAVLRHERAHCNGFRH
jgi:hypothetical protein